MIEYPEEYYESSNRLSEDLSDFGQLNGPSSGGSGGSGGGHGIPRTVGRTITKMFTQELKMIADRDPLHDLTEQVQIPFGFVNSFLENVLPSTLGKRSDLANPRVLLDQFARALAQNHRLRGLHEPKPSLRLACSPRALASSSR